MQDLQTFLALAEPLPEEQIDYLDDEDINLFLQPLEVYGERLTPETQARLTLKEVYSKTEYMGKYGHTAHLALFDHKPFGIIHSTGKYLRERTLKCFNVEILKEVQSAIIADYYKQKPSDIVMEDDFFTQDEEWIKHLTQSEKFPFKYNTLD